MLRVWRDGVVTLLVLGFALANPCTRDGCGGFRMSALSQFFRFLFLVKLEAVDG